MQYKWNPATGDLSLVPSQATERPNLERQGNLLDWGEDMEKLERWQGTIRSGMNTLYTIGYGGRSPQQVAQLLQEHDVKLLLDVRAMPRTRIPGFNKNELARFMATQGITYRHIEALGNANRNAGPDAPVVLIEEDQGIAVLLEMLEAQSVAIMCAEKSHLGCHRTYVADKVNNLMKSLEVRHI